MINNWRELLIFELNLSEEAEIHFLCRKPDKMRALSVTNTLEAIHV